jgi:hypothetical protein
MGNKGDIVVKPKNSALSLWIELTLNLALFWMAFRLPVDRMLIDRHESNQRSNNHYRF